MTLVCSQLSPLCQRKNWSRILIAFWAELDYFFLIAETSRVSFKTCNWFSSPSAERLARLDLQDWEWLNMAQPPNRSIPFVQGCYFGWVFELSSAALGCFENPRDTLQLRALWTSLDLVRAIIVWWFQRFLRGLKPPSSSGWGNLMRHWKLGQPTWQTCRNLNSAMTIWDTNLWMIDALVNRDCSFSIWVWKQARYGQNSIVYYHSPY